MATHSKTLPQFIDRVKADGLKTAADLDLFVDACVRLKQPQAAEELLRCIPILTQPQRLRRLHVIYTREKAFEKANKVLRELLVADPARAEDTWRQVAATAAARERPGDIETAVTELKKLLPPGAVTDETFACLADQLNRPAEATAAYGRAGSPAR